MVVPTTVVLILGSTKSRPEKENTTMVVEQSMRVADVVSLVRDGRLDDFVREAVALVAREIMESEITGEIGAGRGEVAPEQRLSHRNGYRSRAWETRVGEIDLLVPRKRLGVEA
jgi:transposase-like protein